MYGIPPLLRTLGLRIEILYQEVRGVLTSEDRMFNGLDKGEPVLQKIRVHEKWLLAIAHWNSAW